MTTRRFFRIAIWIPLILPALLLIPGVPGGTIIETLQASLVMAGLPYFLFALYAGIWMQDRTESEIIRRVWLLPLLFAPIVWLGGFCLFAAVFGLATVNAAGMGALMVAYELPIGYVYVVVVMGIYFLVRHRTQDPEAAV